MGSNLKKLIDELAMKEVSNPKFKAKRNSAFCTVILKKLKPQSRLQLLHSQTVNAKSWPQGLMVIKIRDGSQYMHVAVNGKRYRVLYSWLTCEAVEVALTLGAGTGAKEDDATNDDLVPF